MADVCTVAASIATWAETSNPCAYPRCGACVAYNCAVCGNWCASTPFRIYALRLRPSNTAAVKVCVHFWIDTDTHYLNISARSGLKSATDIPRSEEHTSE